MKSILVLLVTVGVAMARPQFGQRGSASFAASSASSGAAGGGSTFECTRREASPGKYEYQCSGDPGTIVQESTLWVPTSGSDQDLVVRVPNYNFKEIIRAALRAGSSSNTNIRINVARPEVESLVEGQFEQTQAGAPNVQVVYDGIQQRGEVHYGGAGTPYATLSRAISEPGGGRFKKEAGKISRGDQALRN